MICGFLKLNRIFSQHDVRQIAINPDKLCQFFQQEYKQHIYGRNEYKCKAVRVIGDGFDFYVKDSMNDIIKQSRDMYYYYFEEKYKRPILD